MSKPPEAGQRVKEATAVTGDSPIRGEPDPEQLRDGMTKAALGQDIELKQHELRAEDDVSAVKTENRENDAGQ